MRRVHEMSKENTLPMSAWSPVSLDGKTITLEPKFKIGETRKLPLHRPKQTKSICIFCEMGLPRLPLSEQPRHLREEA